MKFLTKALREKLIKNHYNTKAIHADFYPVVKFFNPCGIATWLITELDPETDIMYGLCYTVYGLRYIGDYPELGYVSLNELSKVKCPPFGLNIEREKYWTPTMTLREYADDAKKKGFISV